MEITKVDLLLFPITKNKIALQPGDFVLSASLRIIERVRSNVAIKEPHP
jgi:hypothetical protein